MTMVVFEGFVDQIQYNVGYARAVSLRQNSFFKGLSRYNKLDFLLCFYISCFGADVFADCAFYMCIHIFSKVLVAE